jgi:hypothetical protein
LIEQVYSEEPGVLYCMGVVEVEFEGDEGLIFLRTAFLKAWISF